MKKKKSYTIAALLIPALMAVLSSLPGCYLSKTRTNTEDAKQAENANMRDYQIELYNDTVWIYDGERQVGRYTSNWVNQIDTILLNDNK